MITIDGKQIKLQIWDTVSQILMVNRLLMVRRLLMPSRLISDRKSISYGKSVYFWQVYGPVTHSVAGRGNDSIENSLPWQVVELSNVEFTFSLCCVVVSFVQCLKFLCIYIYIYINYIVWIYIVYLYCVNNTPSYTLLLYTQGVVNQLIINVKTWIKTRSLGQGRELVDSQMRQKRTSVRVKHDT